MKPGPKLNTYSATEDDYATIELQEYVRCGKALCKKCKTDPGHGPYKYSYHYSPTLKRRVKKYLGKDKPEETP
jgi:hypothetical protein